MRFIFRLRRLLLIALGMCLALLLGLSAACVSLSPSLPEQAPAEKQHYIQLEQRLQPVYDSIQHGQSQLTLVLNQADIDALNHISNSLPILKTRSKVHLQQHALHIRASHMLVPNYLWLNIDVKIANGSEIQFSQLQLGAMPIPDAITHYIVNKASENTLGVSADTLNHYVNDLSISPDRVTINAQMPAFIRLMLKNALGKP